MTEQTKRELVDAVEDGVARLGYGWAYDRIVARLHELGGDPAQSVWSADRTMLRGLAAALEEAIR